MIWFHILHYMIIVTGLVILAYVLARVSSIGWHKSKSEHITRLVRNLEEEKGSTTNGVEEQ